MATGLADRLQWVLDNAEPLGLRNWNASQWSLRAKLERTHVSALLRRFSKNAHAGVELDTLERLANAAKVSVCWLAFGVGSPRIARADLEAAFAMARAMSFDESFLADWVSPPTEVDADALWTMLKADYARWRTPARGPATPTRPT